MRGIVGVGKVAAGDERGADRLKIAGQDRTVVGEIGVLIFRRRAFLVVAVVPVRVIGIERQVRAGRGSFDAGNFQQLRLQVVDEFVAAGRGGEAQRVFGGEA